MPARLHCKTAFYTNSTRSQTLTPLVAWGSQQAQQDCPGAPQIFMGPVPLGSLELLKCHQTSSFGTGCLAAEPGSRSTTTEHWQPAGIEIRPSCVARHQIRACLPSDLVCLLNSFRVQIFQLL